MQKLHTFAKKMVRKRPPEGSEARIAEPAPFPGKWPTKVAVKVRFGRSDGEVWKYIGVPTAGLTEYLRKLMHRRLRASRPTPGGPIMPPSPIETVPYLIQMTEFDRKQVIRTLSWEWPSEQGWITEQGDGTRTYQFPVRRYHENLARYYHPFDMPLTSMFVTAPRLFSKRLKLNNGTIVNVYSAQEKLKAEDIHRHKQWVDSWMKGIKAEKDAQAKAAAALKDAAKIKYDVKYVNTEGTRTAQNGQWSPVPADWIRWGNNNG